MRATRFAPARCVHARSARRGAAGSAALAGLVAAAMAWPAPAPAATGAGPVESLYRPHVVSRFAFVNQAVTARAAPYWDGRHVGRLTTKTEDGTDELVLILSRTRDRDGRRWFQVSMPILPNGTKGWVPGSALGDVNKVRTWLKIDRRRLRLTLLRSGRVVMRARIGVGRSIWPTPGGRFYVRNRLSGRRLGPIYGPLAFGTSAHSSVLTDWPGGGVIGIHGTNQPGLLPGRVSHGCIRLRNRDILRLGRRLRLGTPITIR
jgi:lipoprotein-anchoring transpeptidase ErfK/SrfK